MTTNTFSENAVHQIKDRVQAEPYEEQYSFSKILAIWALASVPGGLLFWFGLPYLDRSTEISTGNLVLLVTAIPYIWHFLLAFMILKGERVRPDWNAIEDRLWLKTTTDPRTGRPNNTLWLWLIPVIAVFALTSASPTLLSINDGWARILPVKEPAQYSLGGLFENPEALVGNWGFVLAFLLVSILTMSEEIIFRGILLPKMKGAFGRADWIANGILFAFYHLEQPWNWPGKILYTTLTLALPARVLRSTWFSMIVHFSQAFYFLFLILGLVLILA